MSDQFTMTVEEIIELASDPLGGGPYTGDKLRKARKHLQLVMVQLINSMVPLSLVTEKSFTADSREIVLDPEIRRIHDLVDNTEQVKTQLSAVTLAEYNALNTNTTKGRPTQYAEHRETDAVRLRFYPTPDKEYTYNAFVEIDPSLIEFYDERLEVRSTYLPAIIAGLTYRMALADATVSAEMKQLAKLEWEQELEQAIDADRETASIYIRPYLGRGRR